MLKSMRLLFIAIGVLVVAAFAVEAPRTTPARGAESRLAGAMFTADGRLQRPVDYRDWQFVSAGLGMSYGPAAQAAALTGHVMFDNVFVQPQAYKAFLETAVWPEGTMFVLELRGSETKRPPNNHGHFQTDVHGVEVSLKDSRRFKDRWAYFDFGMEAQTATPEANANCFDCHRRHAAVDMTFVQFYPTLQNSKTQLQH